MLIHFDIKYVDTGKLLEQNALALHHRLTGQRADIAQTQYRRAVGNHRHQVAARGVFVGRQRIFGDLEARRGDARRIGQRQIALGRQRFGRGNLDLPWDRKLMEIKGTLFELFVHYGFLCFLLLC